MAVLESPSQQILPKGTFGCPCAAGEVYSYIQLDFYSYGIELANLKS